MIIKKVIALFLTLLLIACSNSTKNNVVTNVAPIANDSSCVKDSVNKTIVSSERSEITCPSCDYKKMETMPTDVCLIKYTCQKCKTELRPKVGDCCVFCTYGTHKCPSMQ